MQDTSKQFDLTALADNWPSPLVARNQYQLDKFSGGILNARTLANADCLGTGPKGRVRVGRKIAYPVDSLVEWMQSKMEGVG
jgi:hypothetical protein